MILKRGTGYLLPVSYLKRTYNQSFSRIALNLIATSFYCFKTNVLSAYFITQLPPHRNEP